MIAEFGRFVLRENGMAALMQEAARLVGRVGSWPAVFWG
jgi:hypothetical protein